MNALLVPAYVHLLAIDLRYDTTHWLLLTPDLKPFG